jgi:hypothetical protein
MARRVVTRGLTAIAFAAIAFTSPATIGRGAALAAAPRTFTGAISDDMCARGGHEQMRMGPTDAECTRACVDLHGAAFVLVDRDHVYHLSNQKRAESFAGQRVRVTGTLNDRTQMIEVQQIAAAR